MKDKKSIFIFATILIILIVLLASLSNKDPEDAKSKIIDKKATVESIKYDKKKINIYFFWGNGCPHCEEEYEFWDSILDEYSSKINHIYGMEVWYNKKNAKNLKVFAKKMGEDIEGVPYTVIGNKSFVGFNSMIKRQMKNQIDTEYENKGKNDIYKKIEAEND